MNKRMMSVLSMLSFAVPIYATQVVITNMTDEVMNASIYCVNGKQATQVLTPEPGKEFSGYLSLEPGEYKPFKYDCKKGTATIIVDRDPANLAQTLTKGELAERRMAVQSIGSVETNFFIVKKEERLKIYNSFRWYLFKPLKNIVGATTSYYLTDPIKKRLEKSLPAIAGNPYKDAVAAVRIGNDLSQQERNFIGRRLALAKPILEQKLSTEEKPGGIRGTAPTIAWIFSGGGYRAMVATVGALVGSQKAGLLGAVSYTVGLSGSTWALGTWMLNRKPIEQFRDQLFGMLAKGLTDVSRSDMGLIVENLETKMVSDQPITLVDLYGGLLANALFRNFGKTKQQQYLSQLAQNGPELWPYPIFTALRAEEQARLGNWYEFTPHEIGGAWLGMYIPTWAWGRKFAKGQSVDFAPEQMLGFNFGTFGSAFGAQFGQTYEEISGGITNWPVKTLLEKGVLPHLKEKRPSYAQVFNFTVGLPQSPVRELKLLQLVDAGSRPGFNLPYPPVSGEREQRKADVMIFMDASAGTPGQDFRAVEQYARSRGLKFPKIDFTDIGTKTMSIFKDPNDPSVPLVIYMPLYNDRALLAEKLKDPAFARFKILENFDARTCMEASFCNTFNFNYNKKEAELLGLLVEFNVLANADAIFEAIGQWIELRNL